MVTQSILPSVRPETSPLCGKNRLTISDQVLRDVQGDFDNERTADVGGANEADDTAGDADQGQGGLIHRTSGRTH